MIIKKLLLFLFILINFFSYSQEIEGDWYGEMVLGARTAKLILSIGDDLEKLTITEKNPFTFELDSFYYYENEVVFYLNRINSKFVGKLDREFIKGEWTQNGMVFPLVFSRDENSVAEELKRPQTPIPPFDYYTEELTIENQNSSISLSGTLTLPAKDEKQYPVVVLITGSGPQDRDSEMLGHKSFAVIADHLAKQGIGTFRYDERGVGKSTGKYVGSDLNDFYNDVDAIVNQLLERKEVKRLGLFGHSEGGIIAPRYASENKKKIDFVIMMGAPGVPIPELMHKQRRNQYEIAGMGEEAI
ncbi:MAG: putative esterase, partial [Flavobacteriales bacterium]